MTTEEIEVHQETLGQLLRKTRVAHGYDFKDITSETKISGSNLKAMEDDDYGALPADAFARGFYALYAKMLELDPDEVIQRFMAERGSTPAPKEISPQSPQAQKVSSMAEPSNVSPVSTLGFILLLLIIIGAGFCWFFDINPAAFISEKLRSLQDVKLPGSAPTDVDVQSGQQTKPVSSTSLSQTDNVPVYTAGNLTFYYPRPLS